MRYKALSKPIDNHVAMIAITKEEAEFIRTMTHWINGGKFVWTLEYNARVVQPINRCLEDFTYSDDIKQEHIP